jgi:hypothetical protein
MTLAATTRAPRRLLAAVVRRLLATAKGETMHAALVRLTINADEAPAAAAAFSDDILPTVRSAPGFVAGYWLEPVDGEGFSFVVFETEEQARRSAPPASDWVAPGVTITDVDFRRVAANA